METDTSQATIPTLTGTNEEVPQIPPTSIVKDITVLSNLMTTRFEPSPQQRISLIFHARFKDEAYFEAIGLSLMAITHQDDRYAFTSQETLQALKNL